MRRLEALSQVKLALPLPRDAPFQFLYLFLIHSLVTGLLAIGAMGPGGLILAAPAVLFAAVAFFISPLFIAYFLINEISNASSGYLNVYSPKWCGKGSNEDMFLILFVLTMPMAITGIFFWIADLKRIRFAGWMVLLLSSLAGLSTYHYYEWRDHHIRTNVCDAVVERSFAPPAKR